LCERGLARQLLEALCAVNAAQGVRHAVMLFPPEQARVRAIADELGFAVKPEQSGLRATKALQARARSV
jgi:L-amino acid N-acyltransferase YncA